MKALRCKAGDHQDLWAAGGAEEERGASCKPGRWGGDLVVGGEGVGRRRGEAGEDSRGRGVGMGEGQECGKGKA